MAKTLYNEIPNKLEEGKTVKKFSIELKKFLIGKSYYNLREFVLGRSMKRKNFKLDLCLLIIVHNNIYVHNM